MYFLTFFIKKILYKIYNRKQTEKIQQEIESPKMSPYQNLKKFCRIRHLKKAIGRQSYTDTNFNELNTNTKAIQFSLEFHAHFGLT